MLSLPEPPDSQADNRDWIDEQAERVAVIARTNLRRIILDAFDLYMSTLTAAGDLAAFDSIPQQWGVFVGEQLLDEIDGVYRSGAVAAWNQAPTTAALGTQPALAWAAVINEDAIFYAAQASNRLAGVGTDVWLKVNSQVTAALRTGVGTEALKQEIEQLTSFSEFRADTIARTEIGSAFVNGNYEAQVALGEYGAVWKEWLSVGDARTRPEHAALNGTVIPFDDAFDVGGEDMRAPHDESASAANVINCLVEGSVVRPIGDLLAISRAWWDGPTIEIVTTDGVGLHVTPNHPVLTSRGMIPAQAIHEGDEIVTIRQTVSDTDHDNVQPTVDELYRACSEMPTKLVARASGMNFHGDMPDQRVEVVWPDGSLRYRLEVVEHRKHGVLVRLRDIETDGAKHRRIDRPGQTPLREMVADSTPALIVGHDPSRDLPDLLVGLPSDLATLVYRHIAKAELICLAARPDRQTEPPQSQPNRVSVHTESLSDREHRLATLPSGPQVSLVDGDFLHRSVAGSPSEPAGSEESSLNGDTIRSHGSGDSGDGLASVVATTQVVEVKVHSSGHWVYNLTSSTGLLWSPAAVHSNCRCDVLWYYPGDTLPDGTLVEAAGAETPVELSPEELQAERAAARDERAAAREADIVDAANELGLHPDEVRVALPEVAEVKQFAYAEAALTQRESYGLLDAADAMKVTRPSRRRSDVGGEYDWMEGLDPAERRRLSTGWFTDSRVATPDNIAEGLRGLFPEALGLGDDEVLRRIWLFHSRRVEAAGALRRGRLPSMRNYSNSFDVNDLVPGLRAQGYDVNILFGGSDVKAAAHIADVRKAQIADEAYRALGPAATPSEGPAVWRMSFQTFEEEVLSLDYIRANRAWTAAERRRYNELAPSDLDGPDVSLEELYASTVSVARLAGMEVADYAVIPWA
jgi:hypothetical protein